jgi:UDP-glucose 4-epimerase
MKRDYVFVDDIADANETVLNQGNNEIFNIGTGIPTATADLYRKIVELMGEDKNLLIGEARPGDIKRSCLNIDKIKSDLGWSPKTDLKDGLNSTISYFKNLK